MDMVYAPVIVPTLCRAEHFIRCIESLRRNPWAKYTDLYIGLDYPAKESHWEGYRKISAYLENSFPEFRAVKIYKREKNVGAGPNSRMLRLEAEKVFDRFIYLEDDLEVSPNFLEYMDKALMEYEHDPDVVAVCGYSYPLDWKAADGATVVRQSFNCAAWGRGFWSKKRNALERYLKPNGLSKDFSQAYRSGRFGKMIDFAVKDYVSMCENGWSSKKGFLNCTSDLAMRIYLAVNDKYAVMPLISKVRNHGYDGSGEYCQRIEGCSEGNDCVDNYAFSSQPIDAADTFDLIEDRGFDIAKNRTLLNDFDRVPPEIMDDIWKKAENIARGGKYGGALLAGKKAFKKIKRNLGL